MRNIALAGLALFLVSRGRVDQGLSLDDPRLDVMQLVFGIVFVGFLIAVVFYLRKISEQQTQIMRRIEVMELVAREGVSVEREDVGHPHEGLPIGALMPDFELPDVGGDRVSLGDLRSKQEPVLFFFISPTCNPCKALVPEFEQWQNELDEKAQLVFVSSGKAEDNLEKFGGYDSKLIILQNEREFAELVKARWTPAAVLMDAGGRVASHVAAGDTAIRNLIEQIKGEDLQQDFKYFTNGNGHSHNKIGESVPQFSLADLNGNEIDASYFNGKQTLVAFWSLTCPHCLNMMDNLREWDKGKGSLDPALLVFSDGDKAAHEELNLDSPIILDKDYKTSEGFGMFGTPSAVLVNENGRIISETAMGAPDIWSLIGKRK